MTALLLTALIAVGLYLLACRIWPYVDCGRCRGGRRASPSGKAFRLCSRCGGTGRKRRLFAGKPDKP